MGPTEAQIGRRRAPNMVTTIWNFRAFKPVTFLQTIHDLYNKVVSDSVQAADLTIEEQAF